MLATLQLGNTLKSLVAMLLGLLADSTNPHGLALLMHAPSWPVATAVCNQMVASVCNTTLQGTVLSTLVPSHHQQHDAKSNHQIAVCQQQQACD